MANVHQVRKEKVLSSTPFTYEGKACTLEDDNNGVVRIVAVTSESTLSVVKEIGTIDYNKGLIKLSNFIVTAFNGNAIKIYVVPRTNDVDFTRSDYFEIKSEDVDITVIGVRDS